MNLQIQKKIIVGMTFFALLSLQSAQGMKISRDKQISIRAFHSLISAAKAASDEFNPISIDTDTEHFGAIVRRMRLSPDEEPEYYYTHGVAGKGKDSFSFTLQPMPGFELMGIWHTHGARLPSRRFFSREDIRSANQLQVPFFLADYTGILKVYFPDTSGRQARNSARESVFTLARSNFGGDVVMDDTGTRVAVLTR